jgi:hypothetical protein
MLIIEYVYIKRLRYMEIFALAHISLSAWIGLTFVLYTLVNKWQQTWGNFFAPHPVFVFDSNLQFIIFYYI